MGIQCVLSVDFTCNQMDTGVQMKGMGEGWNCAKLLTVRIVDLNNVHI